MVIKGSSRSGAASLASHLLRTDTNETVSILEVIGVAATGLLGALREMEAVATGARTRKGFYHASISPAPGYSLSAAQKVRAVEALGKALKLDKQSRVVVEHIKNGRLHLHVVWSRIDLERMTAIPDSHNYRRHEEVARQLEREFGHRRVDGAHAEREGRPRPRRTASRAETQQSERTGIGLKGVTADVSAAWKATHTGQAFAGALSARGYVLARGDRYGFVVVDHGGGVHGLGRRLPGVTASQIRARMADVDRNALPSVAEARAMQQLRYPWAAGSTRPRRPRPKGPVKDQPSSRRSSGGYRKRASSLSALSTGGGGPPGQPDILDGYGIGAGAIAFALAPAIPRSSIRDDFRTTARSVCNSLHRVLPLACKGRGGGDERLPRERSGQVRHRRIVQRRRMRGRATASPEQNIDGMMLAISMEVQGRMAAASAGVRAAFALRMNEVCKSLPQEQVEGSLAALRGELEGALAALSENAAVEIRGRQGAISQSRKRPQAGQIIEDDVAGERPEYALEPAPLRLAS